MIELLAILIPSIHYKADYFFLQWFLGFLVASVPILLFLKKEMSWLVGLLYYYLGAQLFIQLFSPFSIFNKSALSSDLFLSICVNFISIAIPFLGLVLVKKETLDKILLLLPLHAILNSLYVVIGYLFNFGRWPSGHGSSGFIDYASANGCLIAVTMLPMLITPPSKTKIIPIALCLLSIVLSFSSIPYGVLACGIFGIALCKKPKLAFVAMLPIGIGLMLDKHLLDSGNRLEAYSVFMSAWSQDGWRSIWFGTGPGSFQVTSGIIQKQMGFMQNADGTMWRWLWMHSDWLQCLFEWGIVGFTLVLGIFTQCLYRLYLKGEVAVFSMLLALGGFAVFNYPARHFLTATLIMFCVVYGYRATDRGLEKEILTAVLSGLRKIKKA